MLYSISKEQVDKIEEVLRSDLFELGVHCVFLIDTAGNNIAHVDDGKFQRLNVILPALAASNFAAISAMAKSVGDEEFSLIFHRGKQENIHFSRVMDGFLLGNVFGRDVSLGFLRLKVSMAVEKIKKILS